MITIIARNSLPIMLGIRSSWKRRTQLPVDSAAFESARCYSTSSTVCWTSEWSFRRDLCRVLMKNRRTVAADRKATRTTGREMWTRRPRCWFQRTRTSRRSQSRWKRFSGRTRLFWCVCISTKNVQFLIAFKFCAPPFNVLPSGALNLSLVQTS